MSRRATGQALFALPNPIHCLKCNLEVDPASIPLPEAMADAVADWASIAGAIYHLELDSDA